MAAIGFSATKPLRRSIVASVGLGLAAGLLCGSAIEMEQGAILRGPQDQKRLALVFTGHEYAEGADTILRELQRHQAKAAFFLTGDFLQNRAFTNITSRIGMDGHYLGPHSDKHLLYCSWDAGRRTLVSHAQFRADLSENLKKIGALRLNQVETRFFLPAYEHCNEQIAAWTAEMGLSLVNLTPGTRSAADYTGEADANFVASSTILESILARERRDPNGLNGFILLFHLGAGPGRSDKFHTRFGELLDNLAERGYKFVRIDQLLATK